MRIVISGIGIVSALGIGQKANRQALLEGRSAVSAPRLLPTLHQEWPVGEVPLTDAEMVDRLRLEKPCTITRNALLGMLAAQEAAEDADLAYEDIAAMSLYCGTTVGGMDLTESHYADWQNGSLEDRDLLLQHEAGVTTRCISQYLHGFAYTTTVSTACSSALNALIAGADYLRLQPAAGRVMVGGTEALTRFHLNGFAALGILSDDVCRPFHPDRKGINLGEGAAFLVLETEDEALRRHAHIYAYVAGYGNRCDAFHQTAPSPEGLGARLAMQDALSMASFFPSDIDYINAHGTATPDNDASEAAAIRTVFGDDARIFTSPLPSPLSGEKGVLVSSTKSLTGHTTSACGSIEICFSLFLMQQFGFRRVMKNAFAFGGNDSSVILSADPAELPLAQEMLPRLSRLASVGPVVPAEDADYKAYISPMEARRMTPELRRMIFASREVLRQAGIEMPDAVIVATRWGAIRFSEQLLSDMLSSAEGPLKPSLFMQSTHNTPAGQLALHLHCHGFNLTVTDGSCREDDLSSAPSPLRGVGGGLSHPLADAEALAASLLLLHRAQSVLICTYDEDAPILHLHPALSPRPDVRAWLMVAK